MYKTIKDFKKLQFPLYALNSDNWFEQDGIVFLDGKILDDLNRPGHSIGLRRLQSRRPEAEMFRLRNPLFGIKEVLQSKKRHFISSAGEPFTYEKTGFQSLKYHLIKNFDPRDTFTLVWLRGISLPLEIPRPPSDINFVSWARILYYGDFPWMVYDFNKFQGRQTRIKV